MKKQKIKKISKIEIYNNLSTLDSVYNETYNNVAKFVVSKIDNVTKINEVISTIYKHVYETICKNGTESMFNVNNYVMSIAKNVMFNYYNNDTPNNATFIIPPALDTEILDLKTYNYSSIDVLKDEDLLKAFNKLDIVMQKVLILYYSLNLSIKDIAITLSYTEDETNLIISKAIRLLEESIGGKKDGKTTKNANK